MKAIIGTAALAAVATFTLMQATGATAPGRPPGVSAADWAPISDTLGVVMDEASPPAGDVDSLPQTGAAAPPRRQTIPGGGIGAALIPPVSGYLMVKRGTLWQRLILVQPVKGPGVAG